MDRIKVLRVKHDAAHIGPLEVCLECKGRDLITREESKGGSGVEHSALSQGGVEHGGASTPGAMFISETANEVAKINMAPECENEAQIIPEIFREAPRCPKHPDEPQIGMSGKRAGQFMGACKICMSERRMKALASKGKPVNNPVPAEIPNRTSPVPNLPQYPLIMVYAVDWHQYNGQHDPKGSEPYRTMKGWMVGFLLEETEEHLAIVHTVFETGDVRYVVVVPKCTVIERRDL